MKLQYLIIIFLLIMTPIYLVFSRYIDVQMNNINIQNTYDLRLKDATFDAIKAFQSNTFRTQKYIPETRVKFSKASVNSFFTSLNLAFGFNGESNSIMKEYVPAVVLTMYDGYYIYAPFVNSLTDVKDEDVDVEYSNKKTLSDLKPYITYSCNYAKNSTNYIITYSLDNYIIVDEFTGSKHKRHEGYLIGLNQYSNVRGTIDYDDPSKITSFTFNGIDFSSDINEQLKEYLIDSDGNGDFYYYTIRNGTKYYFGKTNDDGKIIGPGDFSNFDDTKDVIFYVEDDGDRLKQCENYKDNKVRFDSYLNEIKDNRLGFEYYRNAYVFSNWVKNNLQGLNAGGENSNIRNSANYDNYTFTNINNIFGEISSGNIEDSDSKFNQHRREIIRAVIQTNLSAAISGFSTYSNAEGNIDFIMPKISDEDWDLLENNICIATFLQGFTIGNQTYNSYAVVPNTKTKEFVDEDDIYIIKNDKNYAKVNEKNYTLESKDALGYYPGVWKTNFEKRYINDKAYSPMSYIQGNSIVPYLQSYSSLMGGDINTITYSDMYKYIRTGKFDNGTSTVSEEIKKAYYVALGRERMGIFRFTNYE